eukprot:scaffold120663_cov36-Tisochrysis_lutea.AAC.5
MLVGMRPARAPRARARKAASAWRMCSSAKSDVRLRAREARRSLWPTAVPHPSGAEREVGGGAHAGRDSIAADRPHPCLSASRPREGGRL